MKLYKFLIVISVFTTAALPCHATLPDPCQRASYYETIHSIPYNENFDVEEHIQFFRDSGCFVNIYRNNRSKVLKRVFSGSRKQLTSGEHYVPVIKSLSADDKRLYPNDGQIYIHRQDSEKNGPLIGMVLVTPERKSRSLYLPLDELNQGNEWTLLQVTKAGITINAVKMQIANKTLISANEGGEIHLKIIKNAIFRSYHKLTISLHKKQKGWRLAVWNPKKRKYIPFQEMLLESSFVGVADITFK